ncbi:hypothetical protein C8Q77DRAFT_1242299 [Trametes polyzona]|nr:hypothetical protein C8Q77DRAFT_1242299 [Trametes polyzona]
MSVAGKIYKTHNTPEQLSMLTDFSLESSGITEKDLRRQVLSAVRKAGYKGEQSGGSIAGSSKAPSSLKGKAGPSKADNKPQQRKRKRDDDLNELLPSKPRQEGDSYGSLEFNEVLDEEAIKSKYTVVNRAPIMMAWAFVVAERLGFRREEALSIASAYTEMNAVAKGVSLGLYRDGERRATDASRTGSQPYVELMGRRWVLLLLPLSSFRYHGQELTHTPFCFLGPVLTLFIIRCPCRTNKRVRNQITPAALFTPATDSRYCSLLPIAPLPPRTFSLSICTPRPLYQTASSQWHALSNGSPVAPTSAFSYITRALRQTAPHIVGALRLLAASYAPAELNEKGFALYAEFRPVAEGWGQRGEVRCSTILALRKPPEDGAGVSGGQDAQSADKLVKMEPSEGSDIPESRPSNPEEPATKKPKSEPPQRDEYDAALDDDALFNDIELSGIP